MILFKFPSRERASKMFAAIDNIISMIGDGIDFHIQLTLDIDDISCANEEVKNRINAYGEKVSAMWGLSGSKTIAINRDMEFAPEHQILCLHSDDMVFIKQDFGKDILEAFENWEGLVHFPDQQIGDKLITYPMMHRNYFNRFGYIYHPSYISVFSDGEQHEVAQLLNQYKFVNKAILEHRHHIWGFGPADDLLKRTEDPTNYQKDCEMYKERKQLNFYLT
jgi:hypothetical protein